MSAAEQYDFDLMGQDAEYLAAVEFGESAVRSFLEAKLADAEKTDDQKYIFRAVHALMGSYHAVRESQEYVAAARQLLTLTPPNAQLTLYIASRLFAFQDEPGLALEMIEHGYTVVTNAESAFEEMNYLRESKKLVLAIHASLDPWSDETRKALIDVAFLCGLPGEFNPQLIEAMETITDRRSDNWLETRTQKSIVQTLWGKYKSEERFGGSDRSEVLGRLESIRAKIPDVPPPFPSSYKESQTRE